LFFLDRSRRNAEEKDGATIRYIGVYFGSSDNVERITFPLITDVMGLARLAQSGCMTEGVVRLFSPVLKE
jgi:hypothetical protein